MWTLIRLGQAARAAAVKDIADAAVPRPSFYVLVLLSTAIASYGLLANSTAVVIGAMLIAPLMGPIYGIALGIIRDNRRLFLMAVVSETIGVAVAVGLAVLIGSLPLRPDFGTEILARTRPNLYDLLVAIVAGVAGGYARTSERVSPMLPGVAIATALVPPLAVCGLCLSDARWDAAFGAFLLLTTNLLAIEVAAGAVFVTAGLAARPAAGGSTAVDLVRRFAIPVLLLVPIAAFLAHTLMALVAADRLSGNLRRGAGGRPAGGRRRCQGGAPRAPRRPAAGRCHRAHAQTIDTALVAATETDLRQRVDPAVHLIVRSLISRDADRDGQVFLDDSHRRRLENDRQGESFSAPCLPRCGPV